MKIVAIKMFKRFLIIIIYLSTLFACSDNEQSKLEFRIAEDEPSLNLTEIVFEPTGDTFYLYNDVLLNQYDVKSVAVVMQQERPVVQLILTNEGTKKFKDLTAQNIGKHCAIILNGKLLSAPIIRDTIPGGRAIINGIFTYGEAEAIANSLKSKN